VSTTSELLPQSCFVFGCVQSTGRNVFQSDDTWQCKLRNVNRVTTSSWMSVNIIWPVRTCRQTSENGNLSVTTYKPETISWSGTRLNKRGSSTDSRTAITLRAYWRRTPCFSYTGYEVDTLCLHGTPFCERTFAALLTLSLVLLIQVTCFVISIFITQHHMVLFAGFDCFRG